MVDGQEEKETLDGPEVPSPRAEAGGRIGGFLYFCMRCLALISLPNAMCQCMCFLHEASVVAVVFSSFFVITV